MKLIGTALSPYAVRVMIAARYKGVELPCEPPPGGPRSPQLLALNPIGKVPVLVDGAVVLPESDAILWYLEDRFPTPTLLPGDAAQRANVRLLCRLLDSYSVASFGPFIANDDAGIALANERIERSLAYIDHFRIDGVFASGDAFSAADCALIPFFHAFEGLDGRFKTFDRVRQHPKLEAWWTRTRSSELYAFASSAINAAVSEMVASFRR